MEAQHLFLQVCRGFGYTAVLPQVTNRLRPISAHQTIGSTGRTVCRIGQVVGLPLSVTHVLAAMQLVADGGSIRQLTYSTDESRALVIFA